MKSYLTSRTQRVYYTGSWSHSKVLDCGVPQGSCLGPLLYSIYTLSLQTIYHQFCVKQLCKYMLMIPHCIMLQKLSVNRTMFYQLS